MCKVFFAICVVVLAFFGNSVCYAGGFEVSIRIENDRFEKSNPSLEIRQICNDYVYELIKIFEQVKIVSVALNDVYNGKVSLSREGCQRYIAVLSANISILNDIATTNNEAGLYLGTIIDAIVFHASETRNHFQELLLIL